MGAAFIRGSQQSEKRMMDVRKYEMELIEGSIAASALGDQAGARELSALLLESRMLRLPAKERRYALATVRNLRAE